MARERKVSIETTLIMLLPITVVVVFAVASAAALPEERPEGEIQVRERRFASLSLYLCGSHPHQFASSYHTHHRVLTACHRLSFSVTDDNDSVCRYANLNYMYSYRTVC
ncbi:hypothetical protein Y032_0004g2161 [Ancylostoma ceylanicum]|uniref:Uncharacterized protein n=1 Tax=Ancylostoma ceylanicum TaxID=53326 RepID=A0A016VXG1_9BILA|nr:hypothetical protein Y032_0004g2161 [Ancylostoma ceylanicum]